MRRRTILGLLAATLLLPPTARAAGPDQGLAAGSVLRGGFVQERHLKGFNAPLRSDGHFVLVPGRGLIWHVEKPFAITTVITAAGLVQQVGGNETLRLAAARLPFLSHLYDMLGGALGGDWHALETDFIVERSGDAARWQARLTPRKADDTLAMPFAKIAATGGRFVETVEMTKPDGDADTLSFVDQVLNGTPLTAEEATALDSPGK
ncbi:MAG TPA: outer membrane lipoprotein carrier protein LolA [Aliidongia sp.]|uniref:outer membrane lipoprotein carrier protein LolA n=1 Tax=Aliidongia sp. TaxID=1914230 RepID=UPI002DDD2B88|nr:outer membrane lipoprotein carrier protein LolA [Aliidongia sp.]HEV2676107.1 outer membrane lipoprotein carrier protein LolA [Aliidongia sp.]